MAYKKRDYSYNNNLSKEENILLDRMFKLRLSHMAEELERQFLNPNLALEDFQTRISSVINYEWDQREMKKVNKLKAKATLKYPDADFDQALYESDRMLDIHTIELLQKCDWIDGQRNLLITGGAGAGKTHIANALCVVALNQLRSVKYIRANRLLQESEKARDEGKALLNVAETSMKANGINIVRVHLGEPKEQWFESYSFYPKNGYIEYAPRYMIKRL